MKINIGNLDRLLRIVIGLALIAFAVMSPGIAWSWVGWIGIVPLATGLAGRCPAYSVFGINTCSRDGKPAR